MKTKEQQLCDKLDSIEASIARLREYVDAMAAHDAEDITEEMVKDAGELDADLARAADAANWEYQNA